VKESEIFAWPTDEGVWMGFLDGGIGWFPLRTMYLRDDLPTLDEIRRQLAGEVMPPRAILAIVAQYPESENHWPFTFKGCHPVSQWRRPNADELKRAQVFYGIAQPVTTTNEPTLESALPGGKP